MFRKATFLGVASVCGWTYGDTTLESAELEGVIGAKAFKAADGNNDCTLSVDELKSPSAHQLRKLID